MNLRFKYSSTYAVISAPEVLVFTLTMPESAPAGPIHLKVFACDLVVIRSRLQPIFGQRPPSFLWMNKRPTK